MRNTNSATPRIVLKQTRPSHKKSMARALRSAILFVFLSLIAAVIIVMGYDSEHEGYFDYFQQYEIGVAYDNHDGYYDSYELNHFYMADYLFIDYDHLGDAPIYSYDYYYEYEEFGHTEYEQLLIFCAICGEYTLPHGHAEATLEIAEYVEFSGYMEYGYQEYHLFAEYYAAFEPFSATNRADLSIFTTGVIIRDANNNIIPPGANVTIGDNFSLSITFRERLNLQMSYDATGHLFYYLPAGIAIPVPINNAPIIGQGGNIIGRYSITTAGRITVRFYNVRANGAPTPGGQNFIDFYTNAEFTIGMLTRFDGEEGMVWFDFGNNVVVNINVRQRAGRAGITKASTPFNHATRSINYTVTITALDGDIILENFTDFARRTPNQNLGTVANYITNVQMRLNNNAPVSVTPTFNQGANPPSFSIPASTFASGLGLASGILPHGSTITITYTLSLVQYITANPNALNFTVQNTAQASYRDTNNNRGTASATHNAPVNLGLNPRKTGARVGNQIRWTITLGNGNINLAGMTVTDTLRGVFTPGHRPASVTVTLHNANNQVIANNVIVPTTMGAGNVFTFTIPSSPNPSFFASIVYYTNVTVPQTGSRMYSNTVSVGNESVNASVIIDAPPGDFPVTGRKTSGFTSNDTITAHFTIDVPAGYDGPLHIRDNLSHHRLPTNSNSLMGTPNFGNLSSGTTVTVKLNGEIIEEDRDHPILPWSTSHGNSMVTISMNNNAPWPAALRGQNQRLEITIEFDLNEIRTSSNEYIGIDLYMMYHGYYNPRPYDVWRQMLSPSPSLDGSGRFQWVRNHLQMGINTFPNMGGGYLGPWIDMRWPIRKYGAGNVPYTDTGRHTVEFEGNDAILNFEVVLNERAAPNLPPNQPLFQPGSPAIFFDEFDPRLTFVDGSLEVEIRISGPGQPLDASVPEFARPPYARYSRIATLRIPEGSPALVIDGNTMTLNLPNLPPRPSYITQQTAFFQWQEEQIESMGFELVAGNRDVSFIPPIQYSALMPPNAIIIVRYSLMYEDGVNVTEDTAFLNTAGIHANVPGGNYGILTNSIVVTLREQPTVGKNAEIDTARNLASFSVAINPTGRQLNPGGGNLVVRDRATVNLTLFLESIRAYVRCPDSYWNADGAWVTIPIPNPDYPHNSSVPYIQLTEVPEVDINTPWTFTITGHNEITYVVPDQTPIMLLYDALILGEPGEVVEVSNFVEITGGYWDNWTGEHVVQETNAVAGAQRGELRLIKNDEESPDTFLPGAMFAIYIGIYIYRHL